MWNILLANKEEAKKLAGRVLTNKSVWLQTEYTGIRNTRVIEHGVPIEERRSLFLQVQTSRGYLSRNEQSRHCDERICPSYRNDPQGLYGRPSYIILSGPEYSGNCRGSLSPLLVLWCHRALVRDVLWEIPGPTPTTLATPVAPKEAVVAEKFNQTSSGSSEWTKVMRRKKNWLPLLSSKMPNQKCLYHQTNSRSSSRRCHQMSTECWSSSYNDIRKLWRSKSSHWSLWLCQSYICTWRWRRCLYLNPPHWKGGRRKMMKDKVTKERKSGWSKVVEAKTQSAPASPVRTQIKKHLEKQGDSLLFFLGLHHLHLPPLIHSKEKRNNISLERDLSSQWRALLRYPFKCTSIDGMSMEDPSNFSNAPGVITLIWNSRVKTWKFGNI